MIPDDIMTIIRDRFPGLGFKGPGNPAFEFTMRDGERVRRISDRIEQTCAVEYHCWLDGNYDICHWIEFSTASGRFPSRDPRARSPGVETRVGDAKLRVQISMARPLAAKTWFIFGVGGWESHTYRPRADLAGLDACVDRILAEEGVRILPWDVLLAVVPGMTGRALGGKPPTVYNCLFSEI